MLRDRIKEFRRVPANPLVQNPKNWRTHSKAQRRSLTTILEDVGIADALLVRELAKGQYEIIDGHLRADVLGSDQVPVLILDVSPEEGDKLLTVLDPIAKMAGTDKEALEALLEDLGGSSPDLDELLLSVARQEKASWGLEPGPEPPIPAPPKNPVTRPGDLWLLGDHRLLCDDVGNLAAIRRLMGETRVDMIFTDPPYGVAFHGKGGKAVEGDITATAIPLLFSMLDEILGKDGWLYVCGGHQLLATYLRLYERHLRTLPQAIVWDKCATVMRHNGYHSAYELVFYAAREGGGAKWFGSRSGEAATDIWRISVPHGPERVHPTEKPAELARRAILNSSPVGGSVADLFLGSGGTLVAATLESRACFAMDIEPRWCDVVIERWENLTGQKAKKAN